MNLVWIPGWQFSEQSFTALWQSMAIVEPLVLTYADDDNTTLSQWLTDQLPRLPEDTVLVGWSLGGMLACELARRSDNVKSVLAICTNTQFSDGPGLPVAVAENFMNRYQRNPAVTRRKFAALVDRHHAAEITAGLLDGDHSQTLQWLYDIRVTEKLPCPIHVLLAERDQLVPVASAQEAWQTVAQSITTQPAEHSLPIIQPQAVAQWVQMYG